MRTKSFVPHLEGEGESSFVQNGNLKIIARVDSNAHHLNQKICLQIPNLTLNCLSSRWLSCHTAHSPYEAIPTA